MLGRSSELAFEGRSAPRSTFPHRRGVTLLEVLIALTIFLMALVSIGTLIDVATQSALDTNAQSIGIRLAQSKLAEIESGVVPVANAASNGTIDEEPGWEYQIESSPSDVTNVYLVTVTMRQTRGSKVNEITLSQMIFDPSQSGTAVPATAPSTSNTGSSSSGGTGQ